MDSYVVRIYRRDAKNGLALVGVVEDVGGETRRPFNNRDELWRILTAAKRRTPGAKQRRRPDRLQ